MINNLNWSLKIKPLMPQMHEFLLNFIRAFVASE
jgi:hypothetical protein